ncbi:hypothetical protein ABGB12_01185 [Actinocorallia sp. B10E7]
MRREGEAAFQEAIEWYLKAAEAGNPQGLTRIGSLLQAVGKLEEAEQVYREAEAAGDPSATTLLSYLRTSRTPSRENERQNRGGRQENDGLGRVRGFAWLGIALLAFGFFLVMAARPGSGTPECDGETMEPGDKCISLTGNRSSYTYEEVMERYEAKEEAWADGPPPQALIGYGLMAVSPVLFVAAVARYRQVKDAEG